MTESFEKWFESKFKGLHKMVEDGDHIALNHKKVLWLGYKSRQSDFASYPPRLDEYNKKVEKFINELIEIEADDGGGIHEYCSGFADCAGSVAYMFIRDVGFLD